MKVLIVQPRMYVYGGAEILIVRLANYMTNKGIKNALLTTSLLPEIERDLKGTEIIKFTYKPSSNSSMNYLKDGWYLFRGVAKHSTRFDIVNVHNFPAELSIFLKRKPVVWMCNEPPGIVVFGNQQTLSPGKKLIKRLVLAFDNFIVKNYIKDNAVVSDEFNQSRFHKIYNIQPAIVNYGIDYDFFSARPEEGPLHLGNFFIILHVGMITPLKNQMESIKVVKQLRSKIPDVKLILAGHGDGQYLDSIQEYIRENALERNVEITGHINRDRVRKLYYACDVLIHPVRSQGGWLSPFEALSAHVPVIVSPELTAAKIIEKEDLGVVTGNYSDAILDVYEQRDKYREKSLFKAQWVKENLSWDIFCEKTVNMFHKAIDNKL